MTASTEFPLSEGSSQRPREHDDLRAEIQRTADLVSDLARRAASRQAQNEGDREYLHQALARWEQDDAESMGPGHDLRIEEYERRMKEQDARFEENMRDIRRRLDKLERQRDEGSDAEESPQER